MGITLLPSSTSLALPAPVVAEVNTNLGSALPTGDGDGSYILLPTTGTGALARYSDAGAAVWSVALADINAACDSWTGCFWLDTTDTKIWVWAYDTGTTPDTYYLATVTMAAGVVANIGTCQPGDGLFQGTLENYYMKRAAMGSGNLVIRDGDRTITLNTATGAIASAAAQVTQNSKAINASVSYETSDGLAYIQAYTPAGYDDSFLMINRGGCQGITHMALPFIGKNSASLRTAWPILWGGEVWVLDLGAAQMFMPRAFTRASFDTWVHAVADYMGLPE